MHAKRNFVVFLCLASSVAVAQEFSFPSPQKEHEWLQQFVGEWETESEASMGPGQPPMTCKGTINSRQLGGFWTVSEFKAEMMGKPMTALMTLGYDTGSKKYVGTWVDSMMGYLWRYEGSVDAADKRITLEADGPNFLAPGKTAKFRDIYQFKSPDEIAIKSEMLGDDGKWVTFMTGTARRKKK